jgi:hypothetical protein
VRERKREREEEEGGTCFKYELITSICCGVTQSS